MNQKSKIAIVGIGRWGKKLVATFDSLAEVAACIHKGNSENGQWLSEKFPHVASKSFDDVMTDPTIEAVVIATPIHTHYEFVQAALHAGKHVFVEKPITENKEQAQTLIDLANKKQKILFVGHIFLHHPVFTKLKELLQGKTVEYAVCTWNKFGTFDEDSRLNLLSHDIALIADLMGIPQSSKILHRKDIYGSSDILSVEFTFEGGRSCLAQYDRVASVKQKRVTVFDGTTTYMWEGNNLYASSGANNNPELIFSNTEEPLNIECAAFLGALQSHTQPITDGNLGKKVLEILEPLM